MTSDVFQVVECEGKRWGSAEAISSRLASSCLIISLIIITPKNRVINDAVIALQSVL